MLLFTYPCLTFSFKGIVDTGEQAGSSFAVSFGKALYRIPLLWVVRQWQLDSNTAKATSLSRGRDDLAND